MNGLKIGSLFSGYGGLDMAVEAVTGARTAWVSDIDKGACKILAHRYPDIPNHGDLTAIDWSTVEPVDIITGGFPCQDLSHAGKRAGMADGTRSGLWSYMCEAINIIRPRLVVAENVRGLLSAEALRPVEPCPWCVGDEPVFDVRALGAVLADLADIGYDASWYGLRAADVGACHGRFRVFLIAYPQRLRRDQKWLATSGETPSRRTSTLGGGRAGTPIALLPTPTRRDYKDHEIGRAAHRPEDIDTLSRAFAVTLLPTPAVNDMGKAYTPDEWDAWSELEQFGQYADAIARWETVIGRPAPSPTEPTGKNGAHRLSPRFTEWMMGLPDGWITYVSGITRNEALKACGNGVVPQQAAAALRTLLAVSEVAA